MILLFQIYLALFAIAVNALPPQNYRGVPGGLGMPGNNLFGYPGGGGLGPLGPQAGAGALSYLGGAGGLGSPAGGMGIYPMSGGGLGVPNYGGMGDFSRRPGRVYG